MFKLDTYLTEKTLGEILIAWAGAENVTEQPMVTGTRMRYDYEVVKDGKTYIVEFDGDSHFRDAAVIMRDDIKDGIARSQGKKVVRIPYFVQLNTEMFKELFMDDFEIETTYPHGFIATKMLPASFCGIGYKRAMHFYNAVPKRVATEILKSLEEKAKTIPEVYVYGRLDYGSEEQSMTWDEFLTAARAVHGNKYEYRRDL